MRLLATVWVLLILSDPVSCAADWPSTKAFFEAEDRLRELTAKLPEVEQTLSNDPEGLLGAAILYDHYSITPELEKRSDRLYRKVIDMEPQNKVAFLRFALHRLVEFTAHRQRVLETLELLRQCALSNNYTGVVDLDESHELFGWLREGPDQHRVEIRDFNEARSRIIEKFDANLPTVVSVLAKGRALDPNNAAYDYLEASLDFDFGKNEVALLEVEQGANKPRLESYVSQMVSAQKRVLQAAGFPEKDREILDKRGQEGVLFLEDEKIFKMAEEYEAKHDLANATRVHQTMLKAADQLRQEHVEGRPGGKRGDNTLSRHIEAKARQSLARIREGPK